MRDTLVEVERSGDRVAVLTLHRPDRLNSLSAALADALGAAVAEVADDREVGALVIAGSGRAFCAGADIAALGDLASGPDFAAFVTHLTDAFDRIAECPKPSVAAIHGVALGGGLELALACDLRVADEQARLGVPEVKLGLLPGAGGTARLPRLVPPGVAAEMLLSGEPMRAGDAQRLGLVNQLVPAGAARGAAVELAARLAALPPLALAAAKRLLAAGPMLALPAAIALERSTVSALFDTDDRVEGVSAFLQKRPARFEGR
jgi:enoyl-CoA hydratase